VSRTDIVTGVRFAAVRTVSHPDRAQPAFCSLRACGRTATGSDLGGPQPASGLNVVPGQMDEPVAVAGPQHTHRGNRQQATGNGQPWILSNRQGNRRAAQEVVAV
jgi:hypothetical protein